MFSLVFDIFIISHLWYRSTSKIGFNFGVPEDITSYLYSLPNTEEYEDEEKDSFGFMEKVEEDILGAFELDEYMMDGILTGRH